MRIAIIGAGLFGCVSAIKLSQEGFEVVLYDKSLPLKKATVNNQHRIHLGFHYPRSLETIAECKRGYESFMKEYGDCVEFFDENLYLFHKDSVISPAKAIDNLQAMELEFQFLDVKHIQHKLVNDSDYEYLLNVSEGVLNFAKLVDKVTRQLAQSRVTVIKKEITADDYDDLDKSNDFIINTTYENPNLFEHLFDLKYEYCMLANIEKNRFFDRSITIMDGPFVSLYDACHNKMTLSSVEYTPFLKSDTYEDLKQRVAALHPADLERAKQNLIDHCATFFSFSQADLQVNKWYLTYKTKIQHDFEDQRPSLVKKNGKIIATLNGKITTVFDSYNAIRAVIDD